MRRMPPDDTDQPDPGASTVVYMAGSGIRIRPSSARLAREDMTEEEFVANLRAHRHPMQYALSVAFGLVLLAVIVGGTVVPWLIGWWWMLSAVLP